MINIKLFFLILFSATISFADNEVRPQEVQPQVDKSGGGFAIQAGFGSLYGGFWGASIEYQFMRSPTVRLTPFVSVGSVITAPDTIRYGFGYCLGVNAEFGKSHRFFVGPSFGTHYIETRPNPANPITVVGLSVVMGYKGTARFGLLWDVYGGISYGGTLHT